MKNILFLLFLLFTVSSFAQENPYLKDVSSLDQIIEALYASISGEKGEKRDWELFRFLFKPDAKLINTKKNEYCAVKKGWGVCGKFNVRIAVQDENERSG